MCTTSLSCNYLPRPGKHSALAGQHFTYRPDDKIQVLMLRDKRRRQDCRIARGLHMQAVVVKALLQLISIHANDSGIDVDSGKHSIAAHIGDARNAFEGEGPLKKIAG